MPAIAPKTYAQMRADFENLCRTLAVSCDAQYRQCLERPLFLVGKQGVDSHWCAIWVELAIMPEAPEDWEVVHGKPLSRAITVDCMASYLLGLLKTEPLYVFAD